MSKCEIKDTMCVCGSVMY